MTRPPSTTFPATALPPFDPAPALERVAPIIVFLLTVTVLAELCERAGVFEVAGHSIARRGRQRLWLLWMLFAGFSIVCTAFLSLDTTAVLLTPVALAVAGHIDVPPRPFALTTLWIANTGSLLLPVSNLTNLLALTPFAALGVDHRGYLRLALIPGVVSIVVTLVLLVVLHPGLLSTRYTVEPPARSHDPVLLRTGTVLCLVVGPHSRSGRRPGWWRRWRRP